MSDSQKDELMQKPISRREMLKLGAAGGVGLLLGAGGITGVLAGSGMINTAKSTTAQTNEEVVPFYGKHQQGIITPAQDFICLGAFDLTTSSREDVRKLFQKWTQAAAELSTGAGVGEESNNPNLPPVDTGEAMGLAATGITITFGVGPSLFDDRFGLAGKRPAALTDLPPFGGDELLPQWSGGDIAVQVCANDPQVAFHALRNLTRIARGKAVLRWVQDGFQRTRTADPSGSTPRNLLGFKDGTNNPNVQDADLANEVVWVQPDDGAGWLADGSFMIVRRIRMRIEVWDRTPLNEQEATFGRHRVSGAPLGETDEFATLDVEKKDEQGQPQIPVNSHVALAHMGGKVKIHRRGYSYSSGIDAKTGQLDAGLLFICFNRDPRKQFIPMQKALAGQDKLNEYIVHVGSAIFACLPGVQAGGYIGETLF
ncbi:iron uptake transporter deferrochelatase/peroxidase subunit [Tumebacillus lipolyticus]|uniref:Deferrochelatase n=1 Tax=Tumebacillus lipolyticus TaxID=1280370 RepID=A0ABW5A035_9BACL